MRYNTYISSFLILICMEENQNATGQQSTGEGAAATPETKGAPEQPQAGMAEQQATGSGMDQHKLWAIIGYIIPFLFFVPLVLDETKGNAFARFHANQQLLLLIVWIIGWVLMFVFIGLLVYLFALVLMIVGVVNAVNGKTKKLPLIGGITLIK